MMRVRRQTAVGEVDASAIEELAPGADCDQHRRVAVLDDTDGRGWLRSFFRHVFVFQAFTVTAGYPADLRLSR
jgi:hypothetical protein